MPQIGLVAAPLDKAQRCAACKVAWNGPDWRNLNRLGASIVAVERWKAPFCVVLPLLLLGSGEVLLSGASDGGRCVIQSDAIGVRQTAVSAPLPMYPQSAAREKRTGRVVVRTVVHSAGHVTAVEPLEFSYEDMARAVMETVRDWRFKPWGQAASTRSCIAEADLVFYFVLSHGTPQVVDAAENTPIPTQPKTSKSRRGAQRAY